MYPQVLWNICLYTWCLMNVLCDYFTCFLVLPVFCKAIICTYISCNCLTSTLFYTMVNFYKLDCQTFNQFNIVCNWKQIELKFYLVKVFHMPFNKRWCEVFWEVSLTFLNPLLNYQTIQYKDSYFIIYDWVRIY